MRSVADALRAETYRATAKLHPRERIELALRLGDEDVARYRARHGVDEATARATLARARAVGRVSSPSHDSGTP